MTSSQTNYGRTLSSDGPARIEVSGEQGAQRGNVADLDNHLFICGAVTSQTGNQTV